MLHCATAFALDGTAKLQKRRDALLKCMHVTVLTIDDDFELEELAI